LYEPDTRFHRIYQRILHVLFDRDSPSPASLLSRKEFRYEQIVDGSSDPFTEGRSVTPVRIFNFSPPDDVPTDEGGKDEVGNNRTRSLTPAATAHIPAWDIFTHSGTLFEQHDVVVALALMHWTFACTDFRKTLENLVDLFAGFARYGLLIEWIEKDDLQSNGMFTVPLDLYEAYDESRFVDRLLHHFRRVQLLPYNYRDDRRLYWAFEKRSYIDAQQQGGDVVVTPG
jgi:hypothetical protein